MNKQDTINQALNIITSWKLDDSHSKSFSDFVFYWAFAHTNQHKVTTRLDSKESVQDGVVELAQLLSNAMLNGYSDPIGDILIELGVNTKTKRINNHQDDDFLEQMMGLNDNEVYEPFCGTGALTMELMQAYCEKHTERSNPLDHYTYYLEEVKPLNCAAAVIQIFHKLEYLSTKFGTAIIPGNLKIINIDPITRQEGTQHYIASKMSDAEQIEHNLNSLPNTQPTIH